MADKLTERFVNNERNRHADTALQLAERIREQAAYIVRDLEAGKVPHYDLIDDAVELSRRFIALRTIKDITGIYEAEQAEAQGD